MAAVQVGRGRVVVNFLRWDSQERNAVKARRFFGALLSAMGADFVDPAGAFHDLTAFKPRPGLPHYHTDKGCTHMGSSGWIEGTIRVPETGDYRLLIEASGTKAAVEYPEVAVSLDGRKLGAVRLTTGQWRYYTVQAKIHAGRHKLRLRFTNDYHQPPEDRNLRLGRLIIAPAK